MPWPAQDKVSVQPQQLPASLAPPAWSLCCCGESTPCTLPCVRMDPVLGLSGRQGRRCCGQHPSCPPAFLAGWAVARGCGKARTGYAGSHSSLQQGCWRQVGRQRVAELCGAASNTNTAFHLPCGSLKALLSSPRSAATRSAPYLWLIKTMKLTSPSFPPQSFFSAL